MFAAYAALDPRCKLWMMDGKDPGVEFTLWSGAADGLVLGREVSDAADMLSDLAKRVSSRYQEMVRRNVDFIGEDMDLDVLMIDEAPQFTRSFEGDTKPQQVAVKAIKEGVWKLIAIGRAAGMITIVSAQKPTADIIPSESRDLIDNKLALHCNTRAASKAIVGDGESDDVPADATEIPSGQPGVGFYVGDGGVQKVKTFFIPREHAAEISSRVTSCHLDRELEHLR
jgi:DNA segregation ATPase FtsK/SpoIIIE-like protein